MPDKATMRICAIEDEEYKEEKIECKCDNQLGYINMHIN